MPKGIMVDQTGRMSAVAIDDDSVLSELYEQIGCKVVIPLHFKPGLNLWVDAEGADHGQTANPVLSRVAERLGSHGDLIYGTGVFLGCDEPGADKDATDLAPDDWEAIVIAQVIADRRPLALHTNH